MTFAVFLVSLALEVPPDSHYRILSECDPSSEVRAQAAKNTPMEINFSIAGSPACYSVTATVEGKPVHGYVLDFDLDAVRAFDQARVAEERETFNALPPVPPVQSPAVGDPPVSGKEASESSKDPSKPTTKPMPKLAL